MVSILPKKHMWTMRSLLPAPSANVSPLTTKAPQDNQQLPFTQTPQQQPQQPQPNKKGRTPRVSTPGKKYRKKPIPAAFREQIWIRDMGRSFEGKCPTPWCQNQITVFDFQAGHNVPESKGGPTKPENLLPLCSRCNQSMGDRYTFDEWASLAAETPKPTSTVPEVPIVPINKKRWWWCC